VLSDNGVYMSHVLHSGDAAEQSIFVLASVGHFLPGIWAQAVEGALASLPAAAEVESLAALAHLAVGRTVAEDLLSDVEASMARSRGLLGEDMYPEALAEAKRAQGIATNVVAATYRSRDGELRGCWHGGGEGRDWEAIMASLEDANFNAIFPCMSTGNFASYPSDVLPHPEGIDEMAACLEAARRHNIEVHVWRINWCMSRGDAARRQAFIDDGRTMVSVTGKPMPQDRSTGGTYWMCPSHAGNREIERQAMLELVRKYHPDGIHFDYMRYPSRDYCYCPRCRAQFEERIGRSVENWPKDCFTGGALFGEYKQFRKDLQTSLVREIAEEARRIDPTVQISLAARSALPGAPENDGQDWPTWCREGYLDFVCPMDYTGNNDARLVQWLSRQLPGIGYSVPLYAGLGVTYRSNSLANSVRASKQIKIARDLGADGFLMFSYNRVFEEMIRGLKLGATSTPVTTMPHQNGGVKLQARFPAQPDYLPPKTWLAGSTFTGRLRVIAPEGVSRLVARCQVVTTDGVTVDPGREFTVRSNRWLFKATGCGDQGGYYQWLVTGRAILEDGRERPFMLRSPSWHILTDAEAAAHRAQSEPPAFETDGIHAGVVMGGYGASAILAVLQHAPGIEAKGLYRITQAHLDACDAVIIPQRHADHLTSYVDALDLCREYVKRGGGLMLTHDAVGMRQHPALFADVCTGGPDRAALKQARVTLAHPIAEGLDVGALFDHSYVDHIPVAVKGTMDVVLRDAEGNAVLAVADIGEGRYVANGMCTGLGDGDLEVEPAGDELRILINAVKWLAW